MTRLDSMPLLQDDHLLSVAEAAAFLHLSPGTIYHLISQKRVPVIKVSSRCVRFSKQALLTWLEDLSHSVEEPPPADFVRTRFTRQLKESTSGEQK